MSCRRYLGLLLSIFISEKNAFANDCYSGDVPDDQLANYLPPSHLQTKEHEWASYNGYFLIVDDRTIEISMRFDSDAVAVLKRRADFALDIDVVDFNNILSESWSFDDNDTFPEGTTIKPDISWMDEYHQLSLIILRPDLLKSEKDYKIRFKLSQPITLTGKLKLNSDLSVRFKGELPCLNFKYNDDDLSDGWNYWKLEIEQYSAFFYYPNSTAGVCWKDRKDSGFKQCYEKADTRLSNGGNAGFPGYENPTATQPPKTPPIGIAPQPIPGKRSDLRPDFDVFSDKDKNYEISANHNNESGKPVDPGQKIYPRLTVQVANTNANKHKRNKKSDTIEGPIWWKIEGKTDWKLLASGEYTISKLKKDDERDETHEWNVPNYPGDTLSMKACVDGDDEIWEENESKIRNKITNPVQNGTTNNCSRIERFYIRHPNYDPTGAIESGDCSKVTGWAKDQNTTNSLPVKVSVANLDGTNEQLVDTLMANKHHSGLGGYYGFEWTPPSLLKNGQPKNIIFSATNIPEGPNTIIGSISLTCDSSAPLPPGNPDNGGTTPILNHAPTGAIDETYTCTKVTGWAKDPDTTDSLSIQISAANPDGTNERLLETIISNLPRSDKGGNYGIEWTPPSSIKDGQPRKVTFTAVNVPEGQNQIIGTVPLTCASGTPAPNPTPTPEQPPTPAPAPNPIPNVPSPIPFAPGCGITQQDISTPPSKLGPVGGIRIGTNHHRLFLSASLSPLGAKGFWNPIPSFNPSAVTRVCWNSNSVGWTVKSSRACGSGFALEGSFWVADIPNTPAADTDGTWSLEYAGTEYWFNPEEWGMPIDPKTDHHVSYGIKEENRVEFSVTQDGITTLSGTFGTTGAPGFWFPSGITEQQLTGDAFWFNDKEGYPGTPGVLLCDASTGRLSFNIPTVPPGSEGAVILGLVGGKEYAWQMPEQWMLPTGAELHPKPDGSRYKLPSVPVAVQGSTAGYDPVAQTLTLIIPSDGRMKYAFWSIENLSQITDTAWFMAWISPTGQGVQNIQGSVSRSDTGVWTILFKGVSPGLGGSVYLKLTNGTNAWQNVPAFAYGSGIVMETHPERNEAWYVMPK